ncbi:protein kinase domain-containing protein [Aspergillus udagawae]|uniref:Protein kinase domain-containing protein n=1 Tax=Aspergillus udagawae TaxID=91492 RepID=A0A8E0QLU6_9EURO|nr:uncharacterized protein Aud_003181 [Aspergillus udagawae]GIC86805.1 hypothetical protein Aud_003181 [Aspergillus udagawae]
MAAPNMPIRLSVHTGTQDGKHPQLPKGSQPTPPITPTIGHDSSSPGADTPSRSVSPVSFSGGHLHDILPSDLQTVTAPRKFSDDLEFQYDSKGRKFEFGRGVWSVVYMASSRASSTPAALSPPGSPASGSRVVAVKMPGRRDAPPVLDTEALALTRLSMVPGCENHIVPFHGYIADSHAIVMGAVPLALSTYIEEKASAAKKHISTSTMFDPVQGMAEWHGLAKKLVAGLAWLHKGAQMVHGDIKPYNFLLRPRPIANDSDSDEFPFEPLFADFSSAHPIGDCDSATKGTALTALTPPFTAPELLSISALKSPDVVPTPASDVFSLAVTLLAAATGDLLLYPGTNSMQRLAMAREGHQVIDFARSGQSGARIPRKGIVERIIKPAIAKDPPQRIDPADWLGLVVNTMT